MKYSIKVDNLEVKCERPFNLRGHPAGEIKAVSLEITADLEQLITGFQDVFKLLMPKFEENEFAPAKPMSFEEEQAEARENLKRMARSAP